MFTEDVASKIGFYVYRLIDPRDDRTFYVGKGKGNRVFNHARGELNAAADEELDPKLSTIREIRLAGLEVLPIVHRHGMDEVTAIEVEAALIDAYPSLTNLVRGRGSAQRGPAQASELVRRFQAPAAIFRHNALLVSVKTSSDQRSIYNAARFAWRLDAAKVRKIEYVMAVKGGLIVGVFQPTAWLPATSSNFPEFQEHIPERLGFVGVEAPVDVGRLYLNCRIPDHLKFSQAGIRYCSPAHIVAG